MGLKFNTLKVKPTKDNGTYVFSNFDIGLYLLDTPRPLGEQLSSLALIGGRNIITEKGALVPQYGYQELGQLPENEIVSTITKDSQSASSFFIVAQSGNVYLYTANQGLKKYKTTIGTPSNPVVTHSGKHMVIYNNGQCNLFGGYYADGTETTLATGITIADYSSYYQFTVPDTDADYYWNGKDIVITGVVGTSTVNKHFVISSVVVNDTLHTCTVRALIDGEHVTFASETVTIKEKTIIEKTLTYTPEETTQPTEVMTPELMEVCVNRLFIVDITGRIYYSQIGGVDIMANSQDPTNVDGFHEAYGAGYFEGFFGDTSKTLSIEDFLNGALISKQNGLYYLTLATQQSANVGSVTDRNVTDVYISKIANIGQEYATDHVIVREQIYAYDTYSGSIVNAASVNIFGNLVAGGVIIDSKALASQSSGIDSTKRALCYNGQENAFFLYYGENLNNGIVLTLQATLFPRQLDINIKKYIGFNQGVVGITQEGLIIQDYKIGTIMNNITAYADFEAIGLRDNRFTCSSLLEVTELNGINYTVTAGNAGISMQNVHPNINIGIGDISLPPMVYSDRAKNILSDSFELTSKWADKKANVTRLYAPMSGREGVQITIEFEKNTAFCLAALRLPDFSQGE